ncbi:MAG: hypothetical protein UU08_C0004G0035 [Candidatus Uhrbacteria bacterium GW2011_GWE2_40_58]|nr:MAG: hypothetical protein UT94_C0009G0035 [Candidatus Uhrbacteria bacterium GW2011_GWF2_40_263]KKR68048.1 MAG: hypothetical protein UU08_C0004G0035 [Candidatus Uhrbacteria bacterium GW2011_GWE2_40_58]
MNSSSSLAVREEFLSRLVQEQRLSPVSSRFLSLFFLPEERWDEKIVQEIDQALHFMNEQASEEQRIQFMEKARREIPLDYRNAIDLEHMLRPFMTDSRLASCAAYDFLVMIAVFQRPNLLLF